MVKKIVLWEILVPATKNDGTIFDIAHHNVWDERVRSFSGGITLLRSVTGQWVNSAKKIFIEKMIPVRIACDEQTMKKIADITARHYRQEAVMYYEVSRRVFIKHYDEK